MAAPAVERPSVPFRRLLFPEDDPKGRGPTVGNDVRAVKIVVSRMGCWPWQAFDGVMNNSFAHGLGDAKATSGLEGVQMALKLEVDGVYGGESHKALLKAKVPAGLPHAGEWAWGPRAIALYGSDIHTPHATATLVQPVPKAFSHGHGDVHQSDGLPGYPALDFFAPPGAPVVAPEDGLIRRFSGHDPASGPVSGIHGPFGWTIYLLGNSGTDYFMTHLGSRTCAVDEKVHIGQQLGTVGDYDKFGGTSHTHVGVHGGLVTIKELGKAALE